MPKRVTLENFNAPELIDSRAVARLGQVDPRTARKHLRAHFGPGQRVLGSEKWPLRKVWAWLFPGEPFPVQDDWQ